MPLVVELYRPAEDHSAVADGRLNILRNPDIPFECLERCLRNFPVVVAVLLEQLHLQLVCKRENTRDAPRCVLITAMSLAPLPVYRDSTRREGLQFWTHYAPSRRT